MTFCPSLGARNFATLGIGPGALSLQTGAATFEARPAGSSDTVGVVLKAVSSYSHTAVGLRCGARIGSTILAEPPRVDAFDRV